MVNRSLPSEQKARRLAKSVRDRRLSLILAIAGFSALAYNHNSAMMNGNISLGFLLLGPVFIMLGIGGLFDPRIPHSLVPKGKDLPKRIKVIGCILIVAGLAISAGLGFGVYRVQHRGARQMPELIIRQGAKGPEAAAPH